MADSTIALLRRCRNFIINNAVFDSATEILAELDAHLASVPDRDAPDGYVLVPLQPTDKMVWSLCEMADKCHRCEKGVWDCDNLPAQCGNYEFAREYCEEMIAAAQQEGGK